MSVAKPRKQRRPAPPPGRVRIIGGAWRGRRVEVSPDPDLRPTPDRVRETLFNWLGQRLDGAVCLDLYAGSGVLGFEAASRGAARVVLVERASRVLAALHATRRSLEARQVQIVDADALRFLEETAARFDVVFLDPPFRQNAWPALFERLPRCLAPAARVSLEASAPQDAPQGWRELRRLRAGHVSLQLLQWEAK
ncbi:MAG: 16S rRNA (guanine(966)-N(2))-methyltransferase RsmD [Burkholderiales bacterium]|nr:16S rRNA (guanine(966)-N(2))-methyltransferase RsmD [Burkholderiales bacterium]